MSSEGELPRVVVPSRNATVIAGRDPKLIMMRCMTAPPELYDSPCFDISGIRRAASDFR
jgi:hypothetical protein